MSLIIEPAKIGSLLRSMDAYRGEPLTCLALKLIPYIFPRPIEFRTMEWAHVQVHGASPEWRVPWRRMKMREPHIVPLSRQAAELHPRGAAGDEARWRKSPPARIYTIASAAGVMSSEAECYRIYAGCRLRASCRQDHYIGLSFVPVRFARRRS